MSKIGFHISFVSQMNRMTAQLLSIKLLNLLGHKIQDSVGWGREKGLYNTAIPQVFVFRNKSKIFFRLVRQTKTLGCFEREKSCIEP